VSEKKAALRELIVQIEVEKVIFRIYRMSIIGSIGCATEKRTGDWLLRLRKPSSVHMTNATGYMVRMCH
jgi:hypothetical protein